MLRPTALLLLFAALFRGCGSPPERPGIMPHMPHQPPQVLAVYEAWFGHPRHIAVGYSVQDPATVDRQIAQAKAEGIAGFVVDWYGYREPFIDKAYAGIQAAAARAGFRVAMMYDESDGEEGATDETIEDLRLFYRKYLSAGAAGRSAYLTEGGRPVLFIFPKGNHTDWAKVRGEVDRWSPAPILVDEYQGPKDVPGVDGFYAWINPGPGGWAPDGSRWGAEYLKEFYATMRDRFPEMMAVGGVWAGFNDRRASWSLNRHIDFRCGRTLADTEDLWRQALAKHPMPFVLVETWNDYEEGTAIERGIESCGGPPVNPSFAGLVPGGH